MSTLKASKTTWFSFAFLSLLRFPIAQMIPFPQGFECLPERRTIGPSTLVPLNMCSCDTAMRCVYQVEVPNNRSWDIRHTFNSRYVWYLQWVPWEAYILMAGYCNWSDIVEAAWENAPGVHALLLSFNNHNAKLVTRGRNFTISANASWLIVLNAMQFFGSVPQLVWYCWHEEWTCITPHLSTECSLLQKPAIL